MISVSVVSHNHGDMVAGVVNQLLAFPEVSQIIVTLNVPEPWLLPDHDKVKVVRNVSPKGFGANHNAAYGHVRAGLPLEDTDVQYFCVLNPDIEFQGNPFPALLKCLQDTRAGIVAPAILNVDGTLADSARYFPTPIGLLKKALGRGDGRYHYGLNDAPLAVDWVAGMFVVFSRQTFERLRGFDEKYFLYYEDVDICARAHQLNEPVILCPQGAAIHDARRTSRKSLRFLSWHLSSMARFFIKRYLSTL
ncbi:MAG: glycosyltransferase family 2 protein [Alcaligenaceae bacterium]|nr:glycosyltransferase family 2 protein [Alcaligenaceae bacterium]